MENYGYYKDVLKHTKDDKSKKTVFEGFEL